MKKSITYLLLLSLLINCQEPNHKSNDFLRLKNIGEQIPTNVAYIWAERYSTSKGSKAHSFSLEASILDGIVTTDEEKLGITFHFAINPDGILHILLIPAKINKSIWESEAVIDINTAQQINISIAKEWTDNFKLNNPDRTWSHFFGINLFNHMFSAQDVQRIDFIQGIDDAGKSQLMMFVWKSSSSSDGRLTSDEVTVYDKSTSCPTHCPDY